MAVKTLLTSTMLLTTLNTLKLTNNNSNNLTLLVTTLNKQHTNLNTTTQRVVKQLSKLKTLCCVQSYFNIYNTQLQTKLNTLFKHVTINNKLNKVVQLQQQVLQLQQQLQKK